ncbi:MAG: hypothetical protein M3040_09785 [Bacteroidota bacterium]|nr:hypothetical protein [Bacteroidota bacterium]
MKIEPSSTNEAVIGNSSKSETIRQLARRHLLDQNHTTTDDELKNAVVEQGKKFGIWQKKRL